MPQQNGYEPPERRYDETVEPSNPPNAVVGRETRRTALWTYLGILVGFFLVVGGALLFWAGKGGPGPAADDASIDANAVGTSGERLPRENTPGGFDPAPDPGSTAAELEYRGAGETPQGPMPGLSGLRNQPAPARGRTIELRNVEVERAEGNMFWVRDGDERTTVITAGGMPTVHAGQRVDLTGTIESGGDDVRIRATRIDVR
jgi:hypothetical protein